MKKILAVLFVLVLVIGSGCSSIKEKPVADVSPNFDKVQDLSQYVIQAEPKEPAKEAPRDPSLDYIDTRYLTKLVEANGNISDKRQSYDQYPPEWNFVLVDSRPAKSYQEGHINGAINVPTAQFDKFQQLLPEDKDKLLIFYCGGLACELSTQGALKAKELGYTNIKVYPEGLPGWLAAGNYPIVTSEYVKGKILDATVSSTALKPTLLVDCKPYTYYFTYHIPGAVNMDQLLFSEKYANTITPADKSVEIIVYCAGFFCDRPHDTAKKLIAEGYTNVKVYAGSEPDWMAHNLPMFGVQSNVGNFDVLEGKVKRDLTPPEFTDLLQNGKNVVVLDVRTDAERAGGGIPGSIHIPDSKILENPKAIESLLPADKNTTLLIHCASGARASGVVDVIADELGYKNAKYLNNAIHVHADGTFDF